MSSKIAVSRKFGWDLGLILLTASLLLPIKGHAELAFDNLDQSELKHVINELSGNFNHSTVSGASTLGKIFGFEVGVVGAMTNSPKIKELVKEVDPATNVGQVYDATLIGLLSVPMGITAEISFLPNINMADFEFRQMGLGVKWTLTESLLSGLPIDLALRAQYSTVTLGYTQALNGPAKSDVEYEGKISGFGLVVSKKLAIVEPYFGLSMLSGNGNLKVIGTGTIFDNTFTTGQSASATESSTAITVGAEVGLLLVKLGLEYSNLFGTSRIGGKVSFYF